MIIANKRHECRELVLRKNRLNLHVLLSAVTALNLIQRTTADQRLYDILTHTFGFVGNHADAFALIERSGEIINRQAVNLRSDDSNNHHTEAINHEG